MGFKVIGWICIVLGLFLIIAIIRASNKRNNNELGRLRELADSLSSAEDQAHKGPAPGGAIAFGFILVPVGIALVYIGSETT